MAIIIFILILGILIFVHELGHFTVAKKSGIRVDEFAVGFPPRIFSFMRNGTKYALNLVPFGGYVRIFGENPDEDSLDPEAKDSFVNKSKWIQVAVLGAGVTFNVIFAWILISVSLMSGFPSMVTDQNRDRVEGANVVITSIEKDSPAEEGGLRSGDIISSISAGEKVTSEKITVDEVSSFIKDNGDETITLSVIRDKETIEVPLQPASGILSDRKAIGITMDLIGTMKLGFFEAISQGAIMSGQMIKDIAFGLVIFIGQALTINADLSQVAGPVGIVGLVGDASNFGFVYLLGFTAFISLNLAVLNMLPFPALDGGRILFVAIEGIMGRRIKPKIANTVNAIGFIILILFMLIITVSDVFKLF